MILSIKIDTTLDVISKPEDKNNSSNNSFHTMRSQEPAAVPIVMATSRSRKSISRGAISDITLH